MLLRPRQWVAIGSKITAVKESDVGIVLDHNNKAIPHKKGYWENPKPK
jgi:hypothetical protein